MPTASVHSQDGTLGCAWPSFCEATLSLAMLWSDSHLTWNRGRCSLTCTRFRNQNIKLMYYAMDRINSTHDTVVFNVQWRDKKAEPTLVCASYTTEAFSFLSRHGSQDLFITMLRLLLIGSIVAYSTAFSPALPSRLPALRNGINTRILSVHRAVVKPEDVTRLVDEG